MNGSDVVRQAVGALYGKLLGLPPVRTPYRVRTGLRVPTRDAANCSPTTTPRSGTRAAPC